MTGPGRWLFPALASGAALPPAAAGEWTAVDAPDALAGLLMRSGAGAADAPQAPTPWARMLLFREALRDPRHPARALVENEILDALELVWASEMYGLPLEFVQLRPGVLAEAAWTVSPRLGGYAEALAELAPLRASDAAPLPLVGVRVAGRSVLASSPYSLVFTAEDAAHPEHPYLFRFAGGEPARPLHRRPFAFQRYVATVLVPQVAALTDSPGRAEPPLSPAVAGFLGHAVAECRRMAGARARELAAGEDWRAALWAQHLVPAGVLFAGVEPCIARAEQLSSRWTLRPSRASAGSPPLVLVPGAFDGIYAEGRPPVRLPEGLERLDRGVLPVTGYRHRWLTPADDWLTADLVLLATPLDPENTVGAVYHAHASVNGPPFAEAQVALPLRPEFFRWFRPEDVPRMLTLEVRRPGEVAATLRVPVGSGGQGEEVVVRRVYSGVRILPDRVGPELVVWPPFAADDWSEYAVFRLDRTAALGEREALLQLHAWAGGEFLVPAGHTQRADAASTYAYHRAPEVLELRGRTHEGEGRTLGVIIPRYRPVAEPGTDRWRVGVDVGARHTAVAVLRQGAAEPELLRVGRVLLSLTRPAADLSAYVQSYFFPETVEAEPFGTAVMYQPANLADASAPGPVALNLNLLFSPFARPNDRNRIVTGVRLAERGELLAAGYLRTVAMLVLASAREQGVAPGDVTFAYALAPGSTRQHEAVLRALWRTAVGEERGGALGRADAGAPASAAPAVAEPVNEGSAVLRYFAERGVLHPAGALSAVFDVGAAATNLVACEAGRIVALDALELAGGHLTGARAGPRARDGFGNPFVNAFAAWAWANTLPHSHRDGLRALAADGHDDLAFTALVRSRWYRDDGALLFTATQEHGSFRLALFYFFGVFFHLAGLLQRAATERGGGPLHAVAFAGNGRRFLQWLGRDWAGGGPNAFHPAFVQVLAAAAGEPPSPSLRVVVSSEPKEEVARGLALSRPEEMEAADEPGTVAGERVRIEREGTAVELDPQSCVPPHLHAGVEQVRWAGGEMEIERFHAALVRAAATLAPLGGPWSDAPRRLEQALAGLGRGAIQNATLSRLEALKRERGVLPGNLFAVEAAVVLEHLMDVLFGR